MGLPGSDHVETWLLAVGIAFGALPLVLHVCHGWSWKPRAAVAVAWLTVVAACGGALAGYRQPRAHERIVSDRPIEVPGDGYVTSRTCRACHPHHYATWHASYHRTMTQIATPNAVLAPFDDVKLEFAGRTFLLERRGDEFWVDMDNSPSAKSEGSPRRVQRRVVMTTGSHNLQVYWFATEYTRKLGQLPFDYSITEQRWIPDHASFLRPQWPAEKQFPRMSPGKWDLGCIQCHATHGQPRVDPDDLTDADTRVAEFGISCESCHGPSERHVRLNRDPRRRYWHYLNDQPDPSVVQPQRLSPRLSSQVCGQCHSVSAEYSEEDKLAWWKRGHVYRPGDELTNTRLIVRPSQTQDEPALQRRLARDPTFLTDRFWSDGMVRVAGRDYNGLIESPCFQRGDLSCLSCHTMHKRADDPRSLPEWANDQLGLGMDTNLACLQCHTEFGATLTEHTHHRPASTGSACYNCHMPHTTYGLHKAIRSHQIDSPSVSASMNTGRPNACNLCHLDKTLAWTSEHLKRWYDIAPPALPAREQTVAASLLWALSGDAAQRALVAWSMGWKPAQRASGTPWLGPFLMQLLLDPYPAVRMIAYRSLRGLPGFADLEYDFVGSRDERLQTVLRAARIWKQLHIDSETNRMTGDAILINPRGRVMQGEMQELLRNRDDRLITLKE